MDWFRLALIECGCKRELAAKFTRQVRKEYGGRCCYIAKRSPVDRLD